MKAFTNILVSLLMLSLAGYAVWFTYNQILLDQEQLAKNSQETQKLLQEAREYKAKIAPQIDKIEKDVKELKSGLPVNSNSVNKTNYYSVSNSAYSSNTNYQYSQAEKFFFNCLDTLKYSSGTDGDKRMFCLGKTSELYPYEDFSRITDYTSSF